MAINLSAPRGNSKTVALADKILAKLKRKVTQEKPKKRPLVAKR